MVKIKAFFIAHRNFEALTTQTSEAVIPRCSVEKVFLEISQNSQENTCAIVSFLIKLQASACNVIKKETMARVFSCEFCEIPKKTFSYRTLRWMFLKRAATLSYACTKENLN